jgi:hypothetical protein
LFVIGSRHSTTGAETMDAPNGLLWARNPAYP